MAKAKKLPSGSWRVQVYLGKNADGKAVYKSVTAPSRKEAEFLAAEMKLKHVEKAEKGMTLAEAYAAYIASKENVLSPNTVREYIKASQRDFPKLMPLYISELKQDQIQNAVNEMALKYSPKSVHNAHGLLSAVLRAYRPELRLYTTLPQKRRYERHIPSDTDIEKLLSVTEGKRIHVPILLAAFGSLRREEVAALTPKDVTDAGVWVKRAIARNKNNEPVVKAPKADKSYRFVTLDEWIIKQVKEWQFGMPLNSITNDFRDAVAASGIEPCRFHDLRHYHASVQHALGVPDKYIMERGGWATMSVLQDVYEHTLPEARDEFTARTLQHFQKFDPEKKD